MVSIERETQRVAFLGPPASYTHQAAAKVFTLARYDLQAHSPISDIFAAVQQLSVDYGVVPFENSSNGPVDMTLDCLIDRDGAFSSITVTGEVYLDVNHCILGHSPATTTHRTDDTMAHADSSDSPANLHRVTDIYSHPQAFGQCRIFINHHLKQAEQHEVASTSEAASIVSKIQSGTNVAISSKLAADVYELGILECEIQDQKDNTTRFLVIQKEERQDQPYIDNHVGKRKALLSFRIEHKIPGALADALHVFKDHQLNLTSINSRPSRTRPWHYIFLVEIETSGSPNKVRGQIETALRSLSRVTEGFRYLGCWAA